MKVRRDRWVAEIEALYRSRYPYFVRVARGIVGDRERAVEAVQDGFADVLRARHTFRGDGPLEAWVWRAVVNAALKAARRPLVEAFETTMDVQLDGESESDRFDVAPYIAALPDRQRLVVFLRYYAGLDYRAIATALEIEIGTVSASLATAHAKIRKALLELGRYD
jgi:RNA polymerase sigma-70 factor, ECF subfamily